MFYLTPYIEISKSVISGGKVRGYKGMFKKFWRSLILLIQNFFLVKLVLGLCILVKEHLKKPLYRGCQLELSCHV